ncbi:hypothetical protein [Luteimonas saliphila]|uniref:hypothetical protein n=1 Tax=Luteimonas saliphila TaxID=2804919 RepID=UPI00192E10AF|nr:hypothetical protein [Luteimonas saliphila]
MTTDNEAAAAEAAFSEWYAVYDGCGGPKDPEQLAKDAWRAAIAAHTAASAGEVVAELTLTEASEGMEWPDAPLRLTETGRFRLCAGRHQLYTRPPAAVPADALERLVEEMEGAAADWDSDAQLGCARDAKRWADELAALIPKGADHE